LKNNTVGHNGLGSGADTTFHRTISSFTIVSFLAGLTPSTLSPLRRYRLSLFLASIDDLTSFHHYNNFTISESNFELRQSCYDPFSVAVLRRTLLTSLQFALRHDGDIGSPQSKCM